MKKTAFTLMCLFMFLAACGNQPKSDKQEEASESSSLKNNESATATKSGTLTVEAIASQWANKVITVENGGSAPGIEKLVDAFNSVWPSEASKGEKEVDAANGYLMQMEGNKILSACFWKRANGHALFAVNLGQPQAPVADQAMFYDYDPAKGTLTPEKNAVTDLKTGFEGNRMEYVLPRKGKEVLVKEYIPGWDKYIKHTFNFDGSKHKLARTQIEDFAELNKKYLAFDDMYRGSNPIMVKYALIDIDRDGIPELWTCSENGEDGAFFAINDGKTWLLETMNYHSSISFLKGGAIQQSGGCGTGCHFSRYTVVKGSKPGDTVQQFTQYSFDGENIEEENYTKNDKEISVAEGEKFVNAMGDAIEIEPEWHPFDAE